MRTLVIWDAFPQNSLLRHAARYTITRHVMLLRRAPEVWRVLEELDRGHHAREDETSKMRSIASGGIAFVMFRLCHRRGIRGNMLVEKYRW